MKNIGITGQVGFIGTHLFNTLALYPQKYNLIPFEDIFFEDEIKLNRFTKKCDVIVHLAAVNRHPDSKALYKLNIELVEKLIGSMMAVKSKAHIIFSSSTQEILTNDYGQSKKECRKKLIEWSRENGNNFTGLVIPNVYGPFCKPFYNSVVATFCHQLTHGMKPIIDNDNTLKLIFVGELIKEIINTIDLQNSHIIEKMLIPETSTVSVSKLLNKLNEFQKLYYENSLIPDLNSQFDINLFNAFRSYIDIKSFFPCKYITHNDSRGSFVETMKTNNGGQFSYSTTNPGITRGNHFHSRKIERFSVIKGKAIIRLRKIGTNNVSELILDGSTPSFVDMPIWYTHNITNIGHEELITLFWINEKYNKNDPDTFPEIV